MAAEHRDPYARVATGARSDGRSSGVVAGSKEEGVSRREGERESSGRWTRAELARRWSRAPSYRYRTPHPRDILALGSHFEDLTGRQFTDRMFPLLSAILRTHGPAAQSVLDEEYRAGGLDNLLGRARCRPVAESSMPQPPDQAHWTDLVPDEPDEGDEWMDLIVPDTVEVPASEVRETPVAARCPRCGGLAEVKRRGLLCVRQCHLERTNDPRATAPRSDRMHSAPRMRVVR